MNHNSIQEKIEFFKKTLIKASFINYSRSLFKGDLLVFGLFYILSIFGTPEDKIEWDFLTGNIPVSSELNPRIPNWIAEERKEIYTVFTNTFNQLSSALRFDNKIWEEWYQSASPEKDLYKVLDTNGLGKQVTLLQQLIIIQVFRPDRLESAMRSFICESLDLNSVNPPSLSLQSLLEEQEDNKIPILFVTTLGSDPSRELEDFAEKEVGRDNYIEIPLGAGDNDKIILNIKEAASKGLWICLKNLHLSISWLSVLEKTIKTIKDPHPRYRIFLTAEPHLKFSNILLQSCTKITYETPPGIKKNMERIYQIWGNSLFNEIQNEMTEIKAQALFSLAFIHAILQERRTYIPQGWSKFYEFSYSDLKVSTETLLEYLKKNDSPLIWKNIKGLVINSFYGGRIDNDFDFRVMYTYINKILDVSVLSDTSQKLLNVLYILTYRKYLFYARVI